MKQNIILATFEERSAAISLQPLFLISCGFAAILFAVWRLLANLGNPNPLADHTSQSAAVLDIGVLVFREGLECVLVLAAIGAGVADKRQSSKKPIALGALLGFLATLATWILAVRVLTDLGRNVSALALQAATGLLAVVVLLVVMNWFFHKFYWTGWISYHNRRKQNLFAAAATERPSRTRFFWGMALLGLTSFYREGFEVVLFLQSYRLRVGMEPVLRGVAVGIALSALVAVLTFVAHRRLPYRKMLVLTGILLGVVLVVMVGEQTQEMQVAHWLPTTQISWLSFPDWTGLWFSLFSTVETLLAQALAAILVIGSYVIASRRSSVA
jgi:high-affinity iron transporter